MGAMGKKEAIGEKQKEPGKFEGITILELDTLRELANIGTGNASIALSSLLNTRVNISIPTTALVNIKEVAGYIKSSNEMTIGLYSSITQGISGNLIAMFPVDSGIILANSLAFNESSGADVLSKKHAEILKKLGSVLYAIYLSSIAGFLRSNITFQPPNIISTMGSSIIDFILVDIDQNEKCLLINLGFDAMNKAIKGDFILIFTVSSLMPMLEKLRKEDAK
ncbi:MAG: chemotaxis protein CheC [archaeon]